MSELNALETAQIVVAEYGNQVEAEVTSLGHSQSRLFNRFHS